MNPGPHLAEHELVDALDGTLIDDRAGHLRACGTCAAQVADLRAIAARAAEVDVPEPPAFFWSQLSARVRSAVADERRAAPKVAAWREWWKPAAGLAAAAAVAALGWSLSGVTGVWPHRTEPPAAVVAVHSADDAHIGEEPMPEIDQDIEQDQAWAIVRTLAEDLDHDEMDGEGVSARPGSAERLTFGLSEPERIELARLLDEQLRGQRLPESAS